MASPRPGDRAFKGPVHEAVRRALNIFGSAQGPHTFTGRTTRTPRTRSTSTALGPTAARAAVNRDNRRIGRLSRPSERRGAVQVRRTRASDTGRGPVVGAGRTRRSLGSSGPPGSGIAAAATTRKNIRKANLKAVKAAAAKKGKKLSAAEASKRARRKTTRQRKGR